MHNFGDHAGQVLFINDWECMGVESPYNYTRTYALVQYLIRNIVHPHTALHSHMYKHLGYIATAGCIVMYINVIECKSM